MLNTTQPKADLQQAIDVALASGVSETEILSMVATATADYSEPALPGFEDQRPPIFDELPDGLIDLTEAAKRYRKSAGVLRQWVYRGHLEEIGRLRSRGRNGGSIVIREADLLAKLNEPPSKGGRPRKTVASA